VTSKKGGKFNKKDLLIYYCPVTLGKPFNADGLRPARRSYAFRCCIFLFPFNWAAAGIQPFHCSASLQSWQKMRHFQAYWYRAA